MCLNDLALTVGEDCVKFDEDYQQAQLAANGVTFRGEAFQWNDVMKFRERVNKSGEARSHKGAIKRTEACHLICETRQFYGTAHLGLQTAFQNIEADNDKRDLCETLAVWCLNNTC